MEIIMPSQVVVAPRKGQMDYFPLWNSQKKNFGMATPPKLFDGIPWI